MEFLKINANKLKITLTCEECEKYDIKENGGEFDTGNIRSAITAILSEIEGVDFKVEGEKLLVQLYPLKGGGAELFVTKLAGVGERERRAVGKSENLNTYESGVAYFSFDDLDTLTRVARIMAGKGTRADVYRSHSGEYILAAKEEKLDGVSDLEVISEFASRLSRSRIPPSPEWNKLICEGNAFEIFSKL